MNSMTYKERLEQKLTAAFTPIFLEIKDDSARHLGHAGHPATQKASPDRIPRPGVALAETGNPLGETHFIVKIVSAAFAGKNSVERHRLVYQALTDEMQERVHALSLSTLSPDEYTQT